MRCFFKYSRGYLLLLACGLLLTACATTTGTQVTTTPTENDIEVRATARWDALISGDYADAYQYLSPGYRSSVSGELYEQMISNKRLTWTKARYIESDCTETICKVRISLDFALIDALPGAEYVEGNKTIEESWLLSGGKWYLVPEK